MRNTPLTEHLTFDQAKVITETSSDGKSLYMEGIFVQGEKRNQNQRVYPVSEIARAVKNIFSDTGTLFPSKERTPNEKAISVAEGIAQPFKVSGELKLINI